MSWAHGEDSNGREIGYGVIAKCDFAGCEVEIDRGLAYLCGAMHDPLADDGWGCGDYFCEKHRPQHVHQCKGKGQWDDDEGEVDDARTDESTDQVTSPEPA
jgi:hypothetical protein